MMALGGGRQETEDVAGDPVAPRIPESASGERGQHGAIQVVLQERQEDSPAEVGSPVDRAGPSPEVGRPELHSPLRYRNGISGLREKNEC